MEFSKALLIWYSKNKRELPWRKTVDPYKIWLSEIILQQTRVEQGLPYYEKYVSTFPTVFHLAQASEDQVLKLWQGLGYYSRARNLHTTAKTIVTQYQGRFPEDYHAIKALKGIGDYTASAIASIAFGQPHAVVDGNVYRVLSRVYGIDIPINSTKGIKYFKSLAQQLIPHNQPAEFNQAIMEFGARHCKPKQPLCNNCIFQTSCAALAKNIVDQLPVKLKKHGIKKRYFNYIVPITNDGKTLINQRINNGIWKMLFEFPLYESEQSVTQEAIEGTTLLEQLVDGNTFSLTCYNENDIVHKLSHQHLHTKFWILELPASMQYEIPVDELEHYAFPVLIQQFIDQFNFTTVAS